MAAVRKIATLALRLVLILAILGQLAYLLRRPLLEGLLRARLGAVLAEALSAEVRVGRIGGNWLTSIAIDGLSIARGGGAVRALDGGALAVELDPLALLRGDLAGVERVVLRAASLELDLDAPGAAETADRPAAGAPIDLAALSALVPRGATIEVDLLRIHGAHGALAGPVALAVAVHAAGDALVLTGAVPGTALRAALAPSGTVDVALRARDPMRWARLFAPVPPFHGGAAVVQGELRWDGALPDVDVTLRLENAQYERHPLDRLAARFHLGGDGLRATELVLTAPGLELQVPTAEIAFDADGGLAPRSLRARAALALGSLEPLADLLPVELREQLPIRAHLAAHAADGWLVLEPSFVTTAALEVAIGGGALPLVPDPRRQPTIDVVARLTGPDRLPLPEGLPVRPYAGVLRTHLERDASGGVAGSSEIDVTVHDPQGRASRIAGTIGWRGGRDAWTMTPELAVEGALARELGTVSVAGEAQLERGRLTVPSLRVGAADAGAVRLSGAADLSAEWPALLRGATLDATFDALDLGPLCALAGLPYRGSVTGSLAWQPGTASPLALGLDASVRGLLRDAAAPTLVRLRAATDAGGTRLAELRVENEALLATGSATLPSIDSAGALVELLAAPDRLAELEITARAELRAADLTRLALAPLAGVELTGGMTASADVDGRFVAPTTRLEVVLAGVGVAPAGAPPAVRLSGGLRLAQRRLVIDALAAELAGTGVVLDGALAWPGQELVTEGLVARLASGGSIAIRGRLGAVEPAALAAALRRDSRIELELQHIDLVPWAREAGIVIRSGLAQGRVVWTGDGSPRLEADVSAEAAVLAGQQVAAEVVLRAGPSSAALESFALRSGAAGAHGRVALPGFGLDDLLDRPHALREAELSGELTLTAFDLALLAPLVHAGDFGGLVAGNAKLAGTVGEPQPRFDLRIEDARLRARGALRITGITGDVAVTRSAVEVRGLRAELGEGPVTIDGVLRTEGDLYRNWQQGQVDITVRGQNALLHRGSGIKLRGDLDLTVRGPVGALDVRGRIALLASKVVARIPFVSIDQVGGEAVEQGIVVPGLELPDAVHGNVDVAVVTDEPIAIKTNLFTGGLAASLTLIGPLEAPALVGTISGVDGTLTLPGARLSTTTMLLEFERGNPRFPEITLNANGRRHGIDVQLSVRGPYNAPEILLSSNPPLPTEELLVLVTTGARPETLRERGTSGAVSIVGTYLVEELADYLFGSESTEAKAGFIDRVTFESGTEIGADGTESLLLEFKVRDPFFLQGERDVYKDVNLGIVYRVRLR